MRNIFVCYARLMILKTRQAGDPVLRQLSKAIPTAELKSDKIQSLIDSMIETLRDHPGVGLAAPQVGENMQIIIIEDLPKYQKKLNKSLLMEQGREPVELTVIINPKIVKHNNSKMNYFEGCLSVPGYRALVGRYETVTAEGLDRDGKQIQIEASGWYARILQHEIDHLLGKLYVTKMDPSSFISEKEYATNWADKGIKDLKAFQDSA